MNLKQTWKGKIEKKTKTENKKRKDKRTNLHWAKFQPAGPVHFLAPSHMTTIVP